MVSLLELVGTNIMQDGVLTIAIKNSDAQFIYEDQYIEQNDADCFLSQDFVSEKSKQNCMPARSNLSCRGQNTSRSIGISSLHTQNLQFYQLLIV